MYKKFPKDPRLLAVRAWQELRTLMASDRARRYRARLFQIYVLLAVIAFAVLTLIASQLAYTQFDLNVTLEIQRELPAWMAVVMRAVSYPGYGIQSITMVALSAIILSMLGLRWEALAAIFTAGGTGLLNYLVKIAVRRPRPSADLVDVIQELNSYSFPSGHVMFYTAFFGFFVFLAFVLVRDWRRRLLIGLAPALLVILVGLSRMYLGEHWATDVIAGYLLGSLSLIIAISIYRWGKPRFFVDQPVAAPDDSDDEEELLLK